jgi:hypothetical protein
MKKTKILYWVFTVLFAALMIFSAVPNIATNEASVQLIHDALGYPKYFIPFIGWAKLIGSVIILIPGFKKIKEWAYAGLFFDLAAAVYSAIAAAKGVVDPRMAGMLMWIIPGILSYYFWNKMQGSQLKQ